MSWRRWIFAPLLLALASCSMDGGSSGTGITSAEGNVSSVQLAAAASIRGAGGERSGSEADASSELAGIRVTVQDTDVADVTDGDGGFRLRGKFSGYAHLVFERPEAGLHARLPIVVPAGGELTLDNVAIDGVHGTASAERQGVVFDALVSDSDCPGGTLTLVSRQSPDNGDIYVLRLDGSSLQDQHGNVVPCTAVLPGTRLRLEGIVNADRTLGGAVQVEE